MKYNKEKTLSHQIAIEHEECLKIFDELIVDEGYSGPTPIFGVDVEVIDMDCVEAKISSAEGRSKAKSMDCAFVVNDGLFEGVIFAELRFNYTNLANLDRNELIGKVTGSTNAIGSTVSVIQDYAFVFESNLLQQARNRLARMNPVIPNNFNVYDVLTLKQKYFI